MKVRRNSMNINKDFEVYAAQVVSYINGSQRRANKIKADILQSLEEKSAQTGETDPVKLMGDVQEVAMEFSENLDQETLNYQFEYRSKTTIKGIPLIHINKRYGGTAKGIIAIGTIAIGVISLGGISIGLLSFGGISLGLILALGGLAAGGVLSMGGLAISLLYAFGGAAISLSLSFGGFALSNNVAVGGYASAKELAIGGITHGHICIFNQSGVGEYLYNVNEYSIEELIRSIQMVKPDVNDFILNIIRNISF